MPPATQQRPRRAQSRPRPRRWLSRLAWALALAIMVVVLLPYLLVPLYRTVNPVSTLMLWRWAKGARVERSFVPIERMAPALPMTVIASEDGRFCSHRGIDWRELRERLEDVDDISAARPLLRRRGHRRPVDRSLSCGANCAPLKLSSPRGAPRDARVAGTPLRGPITTASGIWVSAFAETTPTI